MAKIDNAQLSVTQGGNWFVFTLDWRCSFVPEETNFVFDTNWTLMEKDVGEVFGGNDDVVDSTVSPHVHSAHSDVKRFKSVDLNPPNPRVVEFRDTRQWHREDVDTESGGEEIYANVNLRNVTLDSFAPMGRSNLLNVSP